MTTVRRDVSPFRCARERGTQDRLKETFKSCSNKSPNWTGGPMGNHKPTREPQMGPLEYLPAFEVENIVVQPISRTSFENPLTKEISGRILWVWQCNGSA